MDDSEIQGETEKKSNQSGGRSRAFSVDEGNHTLRNTPVPSAPIGGGGRRESCPDILYDWKKALEDIRTESPIQPEEYEVVKTETGLIPLENDWSFWFDIGSPKGVSKKSYEMNVKMIGTFQSVQDFWRYWHSLEEALREKDHYNLRLFKSHIRPLWEDEANVNGGKFVIFLQDMELSQKYWSECVLATIGEQIPYCEHLCGLVYSLRPGNRFSIAVWVSVSEGEELEHIRGGFCSFLEIEDVETLVFTKHKESYQQSLNVSKRTDPKKDGKQKKRKRRRRRSKKKKAQTVKEENGEESQEKREIEITDPSDAPQTNARGSEARQTGERSKDKRAPENEESETREGEEEDTNIVIESKPVPLPERIEIPNAQYFQSGQHQPVRSSSVPGNARANGIASGDVSPGNSVRFADYYVQGGHPRYVPGGDYSGQDIPPQQAQMAGYVGYNPIPERYMTMNPGLEMYKMQEEQFPARVAGGFQFNTTSYFTADAQTELSAQNTDVTSDGTGEEGTTSKRKRKRKKKRKKDRRLRQQSTKMWLLTIFVVFFAGIAIDAIIRFII